MYIANFNQFAVKWFLKVEHKLFHTRVFQKGPKIERKKFLKIFSENTTCIYILRKFRHLDLITNPNMKWIGILFESLSYF